MSNHFNIETISSKLFFFFYLRTEAINVLPLFPTIFLPLFSKITKKETCCLLFSLFFHRSPLRGMEKILDCTYCIIFTAENEKEEEAIVEEECVFV